MLLFKSIECLLKMEKKLQGFIFYRFMNLTGVVARKTGRHPFNDKKLAPVDELTVRLCVKKGLK